MPTTVALDASFVMALFVPHPKELSAQKIFDELQAADTRFIAPNLWVYEVTSSIRKLTFFKEISAEQADRAFSLAKQFRITLIVPDFEMANRALIWSQRLKRASAYDSFYLALAQERGCDLWTADTRLSNAVQENWVRLLV